MAVVDGFSSGRHLVRALRDRGAECVHVRSRPLRARVAQIAAAGGEADWIAADISEIAETSAILRLLSDEASFVVGHDLVVDGGASA